MSTNLDGMISYTTVALNVDSAGQVLSAAVRIIIKQPHARSPLVHLTIECGAGNAGLMRADLMRQRLRSGTPCSAYGDWIGCNGDSRQLQLHGARYVRGGEAAAHHEPQETAA